MIIDKYLMIILYYQINFLFLNSFFNNLKKIKLTPTIPPKPISDSTTIFTPTIPWI
jgi:hypothetical protein